LRDEEGDSYPVTVRLPFEKAYPISMLNQIYVPSLDGMSVALRDIATPRLKRRQQRSIVTSCNAPQRSLHLFNPDISLLVYRARGATSLIKSNCRAAMPFWSVVKPKLRHAVARGVVAGVISLGLVGGLTSLLLTGYSLSFLAIIGFVALIGIEIKNSILLVDFTTQLRGRGLELREAIEKAGEIRFLPVLLTSITAIGGLLPLALSGVPLYAPLAWVIIGGLISSTLLSRIVTPVMYLLIARR
jgi:multidrug efflux pump subunit AcrB